MEKNLYENLLDQLEKKEQVALITVLGEHLEKYIFENGKEQEKELAGQACEEGRPVLLEEEGKITIAEPFCREERMILLGGGHVSLALAEFGAKIGFAVTVVDDRPYFANRTRFPWAREVLCEGFQSAIEKLEIRSSDYVVILTRGHRWDGECLRSLYRQPASAYLGMIGSRRRVKSLKEQLVEEGMEESWLEKLHSPVGLSIGAVTPEEIAISILAEIIETKRKPKEGQMRTLQSDIDMRVMEKLARVPEPFSGMGKAIVTILSTKGSVPRKAGAKMIVYENGMIDGTIGGGCAESAIMQEARGIIGTGGYLIRQVDMTGTVAEEEGMVCGGTMKVLIEDGTSNK
ncbi:MAG: XdhC family protein [Lachnospiraceae bacterium]|nr:XdhC family protein [Lachnospiraceae bacterium]